jgi:hypothetical protein
MKGTAKAPERPSIASGCLQVDCAAPERGRSTRRVVRSCTTRARAGLGPQKRTRANDHELRRRMVCYRYNFRKKACLSSLSVVGNFGSGALTAEPCDRGPFESPTCPKPRPAIPSIVAVATVRNSSSQWIDAT